jgi:hypothetical protein
VWGDRPLTAITASDVEALQMELLGRLRSDRVLRLPAPPRLPGANGRPPHPANSTYQRRCMAIGWAAAYEVMVTINSPADDQRGSGVVLIRGWMLVGPTVADALNRHR